MNAADRETLRRIPPALEILKAQVESGFPLSDRDAIELLDSFIDIINEVVK